MRLARRWRLRSRQIHCEKPGRCKMWTMWRDIMAGEKQSMAEMGCVPTLNRQINVSYYTLRRTPPVKSMKYCTEVVSTAQSYLNHSVLYDSNLTMLFVRIECCITCAEIDNISASLARGCMSFIVWSARQLILASIVAERALNITNQTKVSCRPTRRGR